MRFQPRLVATAATWSIDSGDSCWMMSGREPGGENASSSAYLQSPMFFALRYYAKHSVPRRPHHSKDRELKFLSWSHRFLTKQNLPKKRVSNGRTTAMLKLGARRLMDTD